MVISHKIWSDIYQFSLRSTLEVYHAFGLTFLTYVVCSYNLLVQVTHARKEQQIEELKDELRKQLKATARKSLQLLNFRESIQHLGLAYQFEREIKEGLEDMYQTYTLDDNDNDTDDLTNASFCFRLLR